MSYAENPYRSPMQMFAVQAAADERAGFITKTYVNLAGAIGLFMALETVLQYTPGVDGIVSMMMGGRISWMIVLGLFMLVSYVAENWARSAVNPATQYLGLALYVLAEAVIFVPLIYIARIHAPDAIVAAAGSTLALFTVLTAIVFITGKDFSFMRTGLMFGGFAAMGLIVAAIIFNFALGPIFTYCMIALSGGYIVFHTSNVMHQYRIGQHVAAALALFASVALLFWYILQLFISRRN